MAVMTSQGHTTDVNLNLVQPSTGLIGSQYNNYPNVDITAPKIKSYQLDSYNIDLTDGDARITATAEFTDDLSGFRYAHSVWTSPKYHQLYINFTETSQWGPNFEYGTIAGDSLDGTYSSPGDIVSQYSEPGIWTLDHIWVEDYAGNSEYIYTEELVDLGIETTFTVGSPKNNISVTQTPSLVNEGDTLTTTITTTGVAEGESLYWSATGDIDANDIESGGLTGSALVSDAGTVVVNHKIKADDLTEGDETMEMSFYSDGDRTQQIGNTATSTIKDTSLTPPTIPDVRSGNPKIRENSLYRIIEGPYWEEAEANANHYGGHLVEINNQDENDFLYQTYGTGFWIGLNDLDQEGVYVWSTGRTLEETGYKNWHDGEVLPPQPNNFSFYEQDYVWFHPDMSGDWEDQHWQYPGDGDTTGVISFNPDAYGIAEIPLNLSITTSGTPTEGAGVFTTSINLSAGTEASGNLAEGAEVYWTVSGITADDLESGALEGSGVITDGVLEIEHSLVEDNDSGESFDLSVFSDADHMQQIGNTATSTIKDTSLTPKTYSVTQSPPNSVNEGGTLTTTVATTGVPGGESLYWSATGDVDANDFESAGLTGSALVSDAGTVVVNHKIKADDLTEGDETMEMSFYSDGDRTQQVGESVSTSINDSSKEYGDTYACVNKGLQGNENSLVGIVLDNSRFDADARFESELISTSNASATTGDGNAETCSNHSILGIGLSDTYSVGEASAISIVRHITDNHSLSTNGDSQSSEVISGVGIDINDLGSTDDSSFESFVVIDSSNHSESKVSGDSKTIFNNGDSTNDPNLLVGIKAESLSSGDDMYMASEVVSTNDSTSRALDGDATTAVRHSVLGIKIGESSSIAGDAEVITVVTHDSFSEANTHQGSALVDEKSSVTGIDVGSMTVEGNAIFASTVVISVSSDSGS